MLLAVWSPKGGSGTSVIAAALTLVLARSSGARIADLAGDQPAMLGLHSDPDEGLADWLARGVTAASDSLDRLALEVAPGAVLLPRGTRPGGLPGDGDAGAALAVALRDVPTVVDCGVPDAPAARAVIEVADASVMVVRPCYLALRRAVRSDLLPAISGIVVVDERRRAVGTRAIADILDHRVLARVPVASSLSRAVDAGLLAVRLPDSLARAATLVLQRVGMVDALGGRAA